MIVIILGLGLLCTLAACGGPKATYIQGGQGSSVQIEANATGGHIILTGPFIYCSDRTGDTGVETKFCPIPTAGSESLLAPALTPGSVR